MQYPDVSIILPSHNRAKTLARAIDSVLQQSYPQLRLLIIDDGSNDNTSDLVTNYHDQRISYFQRQHEGVSAARNFGIEQADSRLIAFIDSDDQWFSDKLELQVKYLQNNPDYRLVQNEEIWIRNGRQVNPGKDHLKPQGDIFEPSLHRCTITPSSLLTDKDLLYQCGLFDQRLPACEDYDLWLRITCQHKVGLIKQKLMARYAGHSDQLSEKYTANDRFRIYALYKLLMSNRCNQLQQAQAENLLKRKASILLDGKRKRHPDQAELIALLQQLSSEQWRKARVERSTQLLLNHYLWH